MFKPGDRVMMYRNNEKITYIPKRHNGLKGTVVDLEISERGWVPVQEDGFEEGDCWYIPSSYLKRI